MAIRAPVADPARSHARETDAREASGLASLVILAYVERAGGREAARAVLEHAGLQDREAELRNEQSWFEDEVRTRLFTSAAAVLQDPDLSRHVGEAAIELNVGQGLKLAVRALGSPRLIYSNVVRANAKFNLVHRMELLELGEAHARVRNVPLGDARWHPATCPFNMGILSSAPRLFGRPPARVRHPVCIGEGAGECIYEIDWSGANTSALAAAGWGLTGLGMLAAAALLFPGSLPVAAAGAAGAAALAARRANAVRKRRWHRFEDQAREESAATERLNTSLQDLTAELDVDEVLAKITGNAEAAVAGTLFALLVKDGAELRRRGPSALPERSQAALESWAASAPGLAEGPVVIDDVAGVEGLAALYEDRAIPLRSLCATPLRFRDQPVGVLVALAGAPEGFLPRDIEVLQSYAAQAAIALTNARLYAAQEARASRDALTGLLNHREFHERVARELERCRRYGGRMTVALFDLDDFKLVNDTGGHAAGDRVLRAFAHALIGACRASDEAFRVGGDEFALVLPEVGVDAAQTAARRVAEQVAGVERRVHVSFGVASWPDGGPTKDALLARADESLYGAKRAQRPVQVAAPSARRPSERERLASSSRLAAKLAPLLDPAEIARVAAEELERALEPELVAVHRLDPDRCLRPIAAAGRVTERVDPDDWEQSLDRGVIGRAARTGEPILVVDSRLDPDFVHVDAAQELRSELALPIRVGGEVWGVLNLEDGEPHSFGLDDLLFGDTVAAALGAAIHRSRLFSELEGTFMRTLAALSDVLEAKDAYTAAHAREVAEHAERVGAQLGMPAQELRNLRYAALLHDVGKIGVRTDVLRKAGPLTPEEFEEIKGHAIVGAQLLERIPFFAPIHPLVRSAHERWDGGGYPDGLAGEEIPLGARIICACDALNAMVSERPYRVALSREAALEDMRANAGTQFDPRVVEALLAVIGTAPEPSTQLVG